MQGSIATHLARAIGPWRRSRPAEIAWPTGVVSFSFDDFPKSALAEGGAILEKYNCRGTYYTSLSLAGSMTDMGPMFEAEDLRDALVRGHELGCHTYSHLDCSSAKPDAVRMDVERNTVAFAALLDGFAPVSFAYPFGALSLGARRVVAARYASCRGIGGGINHGAIDLAHVGSAKLYRHRFDEARLRRLIERNRAAGGWLVFYTHDVSATPSGYGCTPEQLEAIVAYASERSEVLPVRDVVARLSRTRPAENDEPRRRRVDPRIATKLLLPGFARSRQ